MREVKRYQSTDGRLFLTEGEAIKHDSLLERIKDALSIIYFEDTTEFVNGRGYYQFSAMQVNRFKAALGALIKEYMDIDTYTLYEKCPTGFVGRVLSDSDTPLYALWCVLIRIDDDNKLWGQPYYRNNPSAAVHIQLNKPKELY